MLPSIPIPYPTALRALALGLCLVAGASGYAQEFPYRLTYLTTDDGLTQNTVDDIFRDSRGYMWFATWNGLSRYNGYDFENFRVTTDESAGLPDNAVHVLAEDGHSLLWIGTEGGLAVFDLSTDRFLVLDDIPPTLQGADVAALQATDEGVWVATRRAGLQLLSASRLPDGHRLTITVRSSVQLPEGNVQSLALSAVDDLLKVDGSPWLRIAY